MWLCLSTRGATRFASCSRRRCLRNREAHQCPARRASFENINPLISTRWIWRGRSLRRFDVRHHCLAADAREVVELDDLPVLPFCVGTSSFLVVFWALTSCLDLSRDAYPKLLSLASSKVVIGVHHTIRILINFQDYIVLTRSRAMMKSQDAEATVTDSSVRRKSPRTKYVLSRLLCRIVVHTPPAYKELRGQSSLWSSSPTPMLASLASGSPLIPIGRVLKVLAFTVPGQTGEILRCFKWFRSY